MSLTPSIYSSSDVGAPALAGVAGSLTALLDAVLVDGYGSGADAKAPLGWSREFSATNKRVYRNSPLSGSGTYLRCEHSSALYAQMRGFETVSDVDTGTNVFPTAALFPNGAIWPLSSTSNPTTSRDWTIIGNERCFYLFGDITDAVATYTDSNVAFAGDLISRKVVDPYCFAVSNCRNLTTYNGTVSFYNDLFVGVGPLAGNITSDGALTLARSHDGATIAKAGRAMAAGECQMPYYGYGGASNYLSLSYPDPVTGSLIYAPAWILEAAGIARARFPGLLVPLHYQFSGTLGDKVALANVAGMEPGTTLLHKRGTCGGSAGVVLGLLFDMTNPWE